MTERALVLCSNDDGVDSPHLEALAALLEEFADVLVVAPERQRSAASHAITLHAAEIEFAEVQIIAHNGTMSQTATSSTLRVAPVGVS